VSFLVFVSLDNLFGLLTSKLGGTETLTTEQRKKLSAEQIEEFRKRFGGRKVRNRQKELIKCQDESTGEIVGCVGLEVSYVSLKNGWRTNRPVAFMSSLAVDKQYRRKGIAKDLIKAAEKMVNKEWWCKECYLFVEENNAPAVKLYSNFGYETVAKDEDETSLIPTSDGDIKDIDTVLLCMKKSFNGGIFDNIFSF